MNPDLLFVLLAGILGLLVGSFSNVLIWRLPRGENIAFPPSHCPKCDHPLAPKDLVPLFSWLSLGGKCRYCRAPINPRYPIVEALTGIGYAAIAAAFPFAVYGAGTLGLMVLFTILLVGSAIDLDTMTIPDELTLSGTLLGVLFGLAGAGLYAREGVLGLPNVSQAVEGALLGAGVLVAIGVFGSWVMRRFRERRFPELPMGYQQISLGLLAGAWLGPWWGLGVAALSILVNLLAKKVVRIPELLTLGGFLVSLVLSSGGTGPSIGALAQGGLMAAGAVALVCGVYWWLYWRRNPETEDDGSDEDGDPVAMGFGDVKLAAAIGAFLGWERLLMAVVAAIFAGAVLGLVQLALKKGRQIKFGPYLAFGAMVALFWGGPLLDAWQQWQNSLVQP